MRTKRYAWNGANTRLWMEHSLRIAPRRFREERSRLTVRALRISELGYTIRELQDYLNLLAPI